MRTDLHPTADVSHEPADPLSLAQKESLQHAVAKIVALGAQVGVSAEQMTELLQSGLSVRELLQYLAARPGKVA